MENSNETNTASTALHEKYAEILACSIDVGPGWYRLVDDMLHEMVRTLKKAGYRRSHLKIQQIKSKFATLRCYYQAPISLEEVVDRADVRSAHTCENCGAIGRVQEHQGWVTCICDRCARQKNMAISHLAPARAPEGLKVTIEPADGNQVRVCVADMRTPDQSSSMLCHPDDIGLAAAELINAMLREGGEREHVTIQVGRAGAVVKKDL